ncbi:hopanoid-associated sugar epimerase [Nitrosomonas sp. PY1]|uniref:hopanoid-associated sugar epimerase n=1 Tax=Nitrosomonas sp. PY1 TaxID=1803906 RepID=UPI001FC7FAFF|nr:hopanoid-associated sugar epimerase [Nitrosomonas sp. PY1]
MRSLVTGATGFLGSAVMRCLLRAGHEVRVLVRENSNLMNISNFPVEVFEGDLRNRVSLERALANCQNLFHVAADYRLWVPDPDTMYAINVEGTQSLIMAASNAGLEHIVYTSSVATLGLTADGTPANEETPCSLESVIGNYKRTKFLAEQVVKRLTQELSLPLVIVNPSTPIGPCDIRPTPTGRLVIDALTERMPAYVNTGLNIAHVDDIAFGHLLALQHGKAGERYILGGDNMSLFQILQSIDEINGSPKKRIKIPTDLMLPIAWCMEKIAALTNTEPRATQDSIRMAKKQMYFSSDKAIQQLGYQYRPAYDALKDAVSWFKENNYCH